MPFQEAPLQGVWIFEPHVLRDDRGYFYESFNLRDFEKATGLNPHFVQDNQSLSFRGVLRGMHFQHQAEAQAKLVRVLEGEVQDVIVDIRPYSPTYGKYFSIILSAENKKQLYIPRGFAHGFLVLSETALFFYKCDNFYSPAHDSGLYFNDPKVNIEWLLPLSEMKISKKDQNLKMLDQIEY